MTEQPIENPSEGSKSPQEELEELLQQSQTAKSTSSGIKLPERSGGRGFNLLTWVIGLLAIILLAGTGYFIVRGIGFNQATVTFDLNEDGVALAVDDRGYGEIDSGAAFKLGAGEHRVHLSKGGFLELEGDFSLERGEEKVLTFELLPIPLIETVVSQPVEHVRLNAGGFEVSYFDSQDKAFKSFDLDSEETTILFKGAFSGAGDMVWSPTNYAAIVKLTGIPRLANMLDNRDAQGAYVPLGERPVQGATKFDGRSTWLFDDNVKTASGWQPILLNENIRQVAFNTDGGSIIYIYEAADGEYSLIKAWPDGLEWERIIVEMPKLSNPILKWGRDDRHLFIEDGDKLLVADLIVGEVQDVLSDWIPGSQYAISTDGSRVAYIADVSGSQKLKIYELIAEEMETLSDIQVEEDTALVWTSSSSILVAMPNQVFKEINIDTGSKSTIPFIGLEEELQVQRMEYSLVGQILMLIADEGVFIMRI